VERAEYVTKVGELLRIGKPNLVSCELKLERDIPVKEGGPRYIPDDEYVVITCKNGFTYVCPVEGNVLHDIAWDVFDSMRFK